MSQFKAGYRSVGISWNGCTLYLYIQYVLHKYTSCPIIILSDWGSYFANSALVRMAIRSTFFQNSHPPLLSLFHVHMHDFNGDGSFAKTRQLNRSLPTLAKHILHSYSTNITIFAAVSHNNKAVIAVIVVHPSFTTIHNVSVCFFSLK